MPSPLSIAIQSSPVFPGLLGEYLDRNWPGWRKGTQETDYILMPVVNGDPVMIGKCAGPGWLDIDGEQLYSAAWL